MCHILISCIVVARRVAHKVQLHLDLYVSMNMYINIVYTCCILTLYIHVVYVVSHATECHVQLVLCNYTNLQLHVSHVTKF
jgi:hypothetical protein